MTEFDKSVGESFADETHLFSHSKTIEEIVRDAFITFALLFLYNISICFYLFCIKQIQYITIVRFGAPRGLHEVFL